MDTSPKKGLVVAHYHSKGRFRTDTLAALEALVALFDRVIVVSTHLQASEVKKAPSGVEVHIRDNVGYDFYSYRLGLLKLREELAGAQVTLMNTSFLIADTSKFIASCMNWMMAPEEGECRGLVRSDERALHLQSYLLSFPSSLVARQDFCDWWRAMSPLNIRQEVIDQYEMGLSGLITRLGYALRPLVKDAGPGEFKNTSLWRYLDLLRDFGILKIETIKANPFGHDLSPLMKLAESNESFRTLLLEGLEN